MEVLIYYGLVLTLGCDGEFVAIATAIATAMATTTASLGPWAFSVGRKLKTALAKALEIRRPVGHSETTVTAAQLLGLTTCRRCRSPEEA